MPWPSISTKFLWVLPSKSEVCLRMWPTHQESFVFLDFMKIWRSTTSVWLRVEQESPLAIKSSKPRFLIRRITLSSILSTRTRQRMVYFWRVSFSSYKVKTLRDSKSSLLSHRKKMGKATALGAEEESMKKCWLSISSLQPLQIARTTFLSVALQAWTNAQRICPKN